jgi:DNA-binding response OmpR family regulator
MPLNDRTDELIRAITELTTVARELQGTMTAAGRRHGSELPLGQWDFGSFQYDTISRRAKSGDAVVTLPPACATILAMCLERPGAVVTKLELCTELGLSYPEQRDNLKQYVMRLRRKLDDLGEAAPSIDAVRGRGYVLEMRKPPQAGEPGGTG